MWSHGRSPTLVQSQEMPLPQYRPPVCGPDSFSRLQTSSKPNISRSFSTPSSHFPPNFISSTGNDVKPAGVLEPEDSARLSKSVPEMPDGAAAMSATWHGLVHTTWDALQVLEACLQGHLFHLPRRPHERERVELVKSGAVFVYEENASGIRRWTDGMTWSPSRIHGNFLIYRELEKPFPPGEKKRAAKRKRSADPAVDYDDAPLPPATNSATPPYNSPVLSIEEQRKLVGSLVDSYGFKEGGLIKKTFTVLYNKAVHHVIAYYTVDDALGKRLIRPFDDERLRNIVPRAELWQTQAFRAPVHDTDDVIPHQIPGVGPYACIIGYDPATQPSLNHFAGIHGMPAADYPQHISQSHPSTVPPPASISHAQSANPHAPAVPMAPQPFRSYDQQDSSLPYRQPSVGQLPPRVAPINYRPQYGLPQSQGVGQSADSIPPQGSFPNSSSPTPGGMQHHAQQPVSSQLVRPYPQQPQQNTMSQPPSQTYLSQSTTPDLSLPPSVPGVVSQSPDYAQQQSPFPQQVQSYLPRNNSYPPRYSSSSTGSRQSSMQQHFGMEIKPASTYSSLDSGASMPSDNALHTNTSMYTQNSAQQSSYPYSAQQAGPEAADPISPHDAGQSSAYAFPLQPVDKPANETSDSQAEIPHNNYNFHWST